MERRDDGLAGLVNYTQGGSCIFFGAINKPDHEFCDTLLFFRWAETEQPIGRHWKRPLPLRLQRMIKGLRFYDLKNAFPMTALQLFMYVGQVCMDVL